MTCPVSGVTICEAGCGNVEGTASIFAAPGWQEVAAGEVPPMVESCCWDGGILPFTTQTTRDGAGSLLAGPIVGAGALSTRRRQAVMVPIRSPKGKKILHC